MGLEIETTLKFSDKVLLYANSTFSNNKNKSYITPINGELINLGKTNISFSPEIISSVNLEYSPKENISLSLLNKYVDDQFMSNTDSAISKLKSYSILDFNFNYEIKTSKLFSNVLLTAMVNNLLGKKYVSNGYYYTYDDNWSDPNNISTIEGVGYYP
jgi:iron complex outermembrane receptor protein